jgi:hypothetical protein
MQRKHSHAVCRDAGPPHRAFKYSLGAPNDAFQTNRCDLRVDPGRPPMCSSGSTLDLDRGRSRHQEFNRASWPENRMISTLHDIANFFAQGVDVGLPWLHRHRARTRLTDLGGCLRACVFIAVGPGSGSEE